MFKFNLKEVKNKVEKIYTTPPHEEPQVHHVEKTHHFYTTPWKTVPLLGTLKKSNLEISLLGPSLQKSNFYRFNRKNKLPV